MSRVIVTRPICGTCFMQVCAASDATDEEILSVCNTENPAGTENGWTRVFRQDEEWCGKPLDYAPVTCADDSERTHFMVAC